MSLPALPCPLVLLVAHCGSLNDVARLAQTCRVLGALLSLRLATRGTRTDWAPSAFLSQLRVLRWPQGYGEQKDRGRMSDSDAESDSDSGSSDEEGKAWLLSKPTKYALFAVPGLASMAALQILDLLVCNVDCATLALPQLHTLRVRAGPLPSVSLFVSFSADAHCVWQSAACPRLHHLDVFAGTNAGGYCWCAHEQRIQGSWPTGLRHLCFHVDGNDESLEIVNAQLGELADLEQRHRFPNLESVVVAAEGGGSTLERVHGALADSRRIRRLKTRVPVVRCFASNRWPELAELVFPPTTELLQQLGLDNVLD